MPSRFLHFLALALALLVNPAWAEEWPTTDFVFVCEDFDLGSWAPSLLEPDDETFCAFGNVLADGVAREVRIGTADMADLSKRMTHAARVFEALGFEPPALPEGDRTSGGDALPARGYVVRITPALDAGDGEDETFGEYRPGTFNLMDGNVLSTLRFAILPHALDDGGADGRVTLHVAELHTTLAHELFHAVQEAHMLDAEHRRDLLEEGWIHEGTADAMGEVALHAYAQSDGAFDPGALARAELPPLGTEPGEGRLSHAEGLPIVEPVVASYHTHDFWLHILSNRQIGDYGALADLYRTDDAIAPEMGLDMVDAWLRRHGTHLVEAMETLAVDATSPGTQAHGALRSLFDCDDEAVPIDDTTTPPLAHWGSSGAGALSDSAGMFGDLRAHCYRIDVQDENSAVTVRLLAAYELYSTSPRIRLVMDGKVLSDGEEVLLLPGEDEASTAILFMSEPEELTQPEKLGPAVFTVQFEGKAKADCTPRDALWMNYRSGYFLQVPDLAQQRWNRVSSFLRTSAMARPVEGCMRLTRTILPDGRSTWTLVHVTPDLSHMETWGFHMPPGTLEPGRLGAGDTVVIGPEHIRSITEGSELAAEAVARHATLAEAWNGIHGARFYGSLNARTLTLDIESIGETGLTALMTLEIAGMSYQSGGSSTDTLVVTGRVELAYDVIRPTPTAEGLRQAARVAAIGARMADATAIADYAIRRFGDRSGWKRPFDATDPEFHDFFFSTTMAP